MQSHTAEARLWHVLGMALLAGGGLPLGLDALHMASTGSVEADALNVAVGYAAIILIGFAALVVSRVLTARDGLQFEHLDWIWTVIAWLAIPLGAAIFDFEWNGTLAGAATMEQKATLLAGAFIFLAGLIAMLGERAVQRIQYRTLRRTLDVAEQRNLADAHHGPMN